jgi:hypothetical protein
VNWLHKNTTRTIAVAGLAVCGALITSASMTVASTTTLKTVTNSDKTASVGLPDGWKLAKGSNGYIYVTGPNDDRINLGASIVAKNAPAGTSVGSGAMFALPYSASLKDKYTTIVQLGAAQQGLPKLQLTFASQTGGGQSRKFEAVLCSLQPDYLGFYKNIVFLANIPANRVAQDRAIVEQIVSSYRLTPDMFKKLLSSYTPLPPHPAAAISGAVSGMAPYEDPTNSDCFDYNVIRESPPWEVPMHCGGTKPE